MRMRLPDTEWEFTGPYLPVGECGPRLEGLRQPFEGVIWWFETGGQRREMPAGVRCLAGPFQPLPAVA